ncbi:hypothetical protein BD289DRAFT_236347 [Coniella lustricola]|uniref:Thioredoxin-like fold domain-containing protein n=1 Tax=Coniella lustricola TaxID=2025994 RepID=A0A2T3A9N0_9PEZI|nr:hypothetical protein BD289DRAFT_236347 [Coniella lustricola]
MTTTRATPQPTSGGESHHSDNHSSSSSSSSWIPPIPRPLESLFAAVPLVVYAANSLPSRSPAHSSLPALHVFASDHDAARGLPSYNPSCLKWQTYLRLASIPHRLVASTNHASPTGSLPFLQPAIAPGPEARLDARHLLPIPSSRLDTYVRQHGSLPSDRPPSSTSPSQLPTSHQKQPHQTPDQRHHRQQAYQALLDTSIRNAWLYALYLSPANEPLLRSLYINPTSRSALVRATLLQQLRAAARAEIAKAGNGTTTTNTSSNEDGKRSHSDDGSIGSRLFTWALGGRAAVNPATVYAAARSALLALEMLLAQSAASDANQQWAEMDSEAAESDEFDDDFGFSTTTTTTTTRRKENSNRAISSKGPWFFSSTHPTLFDASVFSYTYLILHAGHIHHDSDQKDIEKANQDKAGNKDNARPSARTTRWEDDTLRQILVQECPQLVAHVQRIVDRCWGADVSQTL